MVERHLHSICYFSDSVDICYDFSPKGDTTGASFFYYTTKGDDSLDIWIEEEGNDTIRYFNDSNGLMMDATKWAGDEEYDTILYSYNDHGKEIESRTKYSWSDTYSIDSSYYLSDTLLIKKLEFDQDGYVERREIHTNNRKGLNIRTDYYNTSEHYLISKRRFFRNGKLKKYRSTLFQEHDRKKTVKCYSKDGKAISEVVRITKKKGESLKVDLNDEWTFKKRSTLFTYFSDDVHKSVIKLKPQGTTIVRESISVQGVHLPN